MFDQLKKMLAVALTCSALVFSTGALAQASEEDCVVTNAGTSIAQRMGVLSTQNVRRAITPALRKYNLGCLARTINFGGFGRIGAGIGSAIRRMIGGISGDALCQVVLDAISQVSPPADGSHQSELAADLERVAIVPPPLRAVRQRGV